jgi:aryl-alcohol dehydrogenase-like predicted oxidoreductase
MAEEYTIMTNTTTIRPGGEALLAGHPVARIGYGAMQLGALPGSEEAEPETAVALLHRAVELGVNHFDTTQFYGEGHVNRMLRRALAPYADDIVLVSKIGSRPVPGSGRLTAAQKPAELREAVEQNLETLGIERLAAVYLRRPDRNPHPVEDPEQRVNLDDQLAEMVALRDEGKIGAIGLSAVLPEQLEQALPVGIVCVQNEYSMLNRTDEAMLELCERAGIAWVPFFPLGSAFQGIRKVVDEPAVRDAAATLDATPAQIGLAWLLQHSSQVHLIPGTGSLNHLAENVAVGNVTLPTSTVERLDALAAEPAPDGTN